MRKKFRGLSYGSPLVLNEDLLDAVLSGHKTINVRVLSKKERGDHIRDIDGWPYYYSNATSSWEKLPGPYGDIGNYLWVREGYALVEGSVVYKHDVREEDKKHYEWGQILTMPEEVSRICLKVEGYRYLPGIQNIKSMDIYREGFSSAARGKEGKDDLRSKFAKHWDHRYKEPEDKWDANPPAWITDFRLLSAEEEAKMKKAKDYLK